MIDKEPSKSVLRHLTGMSSTVLARFDKGEEVSMSLMRKICTALDCNIGDVMDFGAGLKNKRLIFIPGSR